jgi:hypothetical protein
MAPGVPKRDWRDNGGTAQTNRKSDPMSMLRVPASLALNRPLPTRVR